MKKSNIHSLALQWLWLRSCSISKGHGYVQCGTLVWNFDARPSPLSRTYKLRIKYKQGKSPDIFVVAPDINKLAQGRSLPHVYSTKPVRLCLYYPKSAEWSADQLITNTIVPWAYLWLFYFEEWLISNEWQGGGKHPGESDDA